MAKEKKESILFPDTNVCGEKVRPWTYSQFVAILPALEKTVGILEQHGITWEKFSEAVDQKKVRELIGTVSVLLPVIPGVVSKTLAVDESAVEKWDFDKATAVFLVIMIQNARRLKNFLGLGLMAIREMKTT